jgi:putrescine---pyruvate transaminase
VVFTPAVMAARPDAPLIVAAGAREAGLIVRNLGSGVAVSPPLTIQREHLALITEGIGHGLERLAAAVPAR